MYIGIDVGGTKVRIGSFTDLKSITPTKTVDLPSDSLQNYKKAVKKIAAEVESLVGEDGHNDITGVGISMSGQVDVTKGVIKESQFLPEWNEKYIAKDIQKYLPNAPQVSLENDSVCAALAEYEFGKAKDSTYYASISVGTGIGITIVKELTSHIAIFSTEAGHMVVEIDGKKCACGQIGCVEAYASGRGLSNLIDEELLTKTEIQIISTRYLSQTLMNLLIVHNVDKLIFSGGLASNDRRYMENLVSQVEQMTVIRSVFKYPEFLVSDLLDNAGLVGAISLLKNPNIMKLSNV